MSVPNIDEIDRAKKKRQPISRDPPKLMKFDVFSNMSSSGVRHGRKNPFFEKIQKQAPRRPPWANLYKK